MDYIKEYEKWKSTKLGFNLNEELNKMNEEEIKYSFNKYLEFGTAGMRGILGPGTNKMNVHSIAWVTKGFANVLLKEYEKPSVVIGYDVRHMSEEFAKTAATVLATSGIQVHLFPHIAPTPLVSYGVRELKASAGIMITASHNPKEYNGYKVYNSDGAQIVGSFSGKITKELNSIKMLDTKINNYEDYFNNKIKLIDRKLIDSYINKTRKLSYQDNTNKNISIVFTPLNGTGLMVEEVLKLNGYSNVLVVPEERNPDPNFTTTSIPNPENPEVFRLAEQLGKTVGADVLLATDPDADRIGVKVLNKDKYTFLSGNEIGLLLANYILNSLDNNINSKNAIIKTIVTSKLIDKIAEDKGVKVFDVLVGFKNIYELVALWEDTEEYNFILGFEESFGYGLSTIVRDKDAISASVVITEMVSFYKERNENMIEVLNSIYDKYGYIEEEMFSIKLGNDNSLVEQVMKDFRENPINKIDDLDFLKTVDYLVDSTGLPKNNSITCFYSGDNWFAIRPSGTEPKLKFYVYGYGKDKKTAKKNASNIKKYIKEKVSK